MQTLTEKRVYGDRGGARACFVASDTGLVRVRVTGTAVGEFSLVDRRSARDLAVDRPTRGADRDADGGQSAADLPPSTLAVATDSDVLVARIPRPLDRDAEPAGPAAVEETLATTGFGPAAAVDVTAASLIAAAPDGEIRRSAPIGGGPDDGEWRPIEGPADLSVRAVDAPLVATDRGVFRIVDDRLQPAGLEDVADVDATDDPLAATPSGLYALGNGWQSVLDEPTEAVSVAAGAARTDQPRTHAVSGSAVYAVEPSPERVATADDPLVDLAHGDPGHVYAITADGTVLAAGPDDVRHHPLGVRDAAGIVALGR